MSDRQGGPPAYYWSSSDTSRTRLVWDPEVHDFYGERCYYYLIAASRVETAGTMSGDLARLLTSLAIHSGTVHALFGPSDMLVRFWASAPARQRFIRGLRQSSLEIESIREFTAESVQYGASRLASPAEKQVAASRTLIEESVRAERRDPGSAIEPQRAAELLRLGLVHVVPPTIGVKFFVFFKSRVGIESQPSSYVLREIARTAADTSLDGLSLYSGIGFADYILKAVVPEFGGLLPVVNELRRAGKGLHLNAWTLPVADFGTAKVGETVDAIDGDLSTELEALIGVAADDEARRTLRREIGSMSRDQQEGLTRLIRKLRPQAQGPDLERFDETVAACVRQSRKDLNRAASFLTSIEDDLRFFVPRFLAEKIGTGWLEDLRSVGLQKDAPGSARLGTDEEEESGWIRPGTGPAQWSLYGLFSALNVAYRQFDGDLSAELDDLFGSDWRKEIRNIVSLRDDFAHGKFMAAVRGGKYDGELGAKLETLMIASRFQSTLEQQADAIRTR